MSRSFIAIGALFFTAVALIAGCSSPPDACSEHVASSTTSTSPSLLLIETREGYGQQVRPVDPVSLEALPGYEPIDFSRRYDHVVSPDGQMLAAMLHPDDSPGNPGWQLRVIDLGSWTDKVIDLDVNQRSKGLVFSPDGKAIYWAQPTGQDPAHGIPVEYELYRYEVASGSLGSVGNQHKWDSLGPERSGVWKSLGELPEGPVMKSSPIDSLSLHLPSAL